jgi:hypothetical protein
MTVFYFFLWFFSSAHFRGHFYRICLSAALLSTGSDLNLEFLLVYNQRVRRTGEQTDAVGHIELTQTRLNYLLRAAGESISFSVISDLLPLVREPLCTF